MPKPLTELERRVLAYLVEYLRRNTYQPSIREIGREFTIRSTKTVSELLQSLADKGWIERDPSRSRGVKLLGLDSGADTVAVPLLAGTPPDAVDEYVIDRRLVGSAGVFLVVMEGGHLVPQGIHPGDLLLVEPVQSTALQPDDLVLVDVAGLASVRECRGAGSEGVVLNGAGPEAAPLALTHRQAASAVQGRVTGMVRRIPITRLHASADSITAG